MYDPPGYVWAIIIAGMIAIPAATCVVLYGGAVRAGLGRTRAALLAGGAAVLLGGWFTASAVIADHGWYHTRLGHGVPWLPVATLGFFGLLLALRQIPVVARALTAPGTVNRLVYPHTFRVTGVAFLLTWPSAICPRYSPCPRAWVTSPPVSPRRWSRAGSRRARAAAPPCGSTFRHDRSGPALVLGGLTGFQLIGVTPSAAPLSALPLALVIAAAVPVLFALHITSVSALARAARPASSAVGPVISGVTRRAAVPPSPASRVG